MPRWSSDSSTSIARWPWRSRPISSSSAPSGHCSRQSAASTSAAKRSSVERESPTSRWAATRAARRTTTGSARRSARAVSSTSRSTTTRPVAHLFLVAELVPGHVAPRSTGDPGDAAGGGGDVGHHHVGRRRAEPGRHGVLVLQPQHVARAFLLPVQGDPDVDERAVAAVENRQIVGRHDEVGVRGPPQRVHVAQPAVAVLEVRFQQIGDIARLGAALDDLRAQCIEPAAAVAAPARQAFGDEPGAELVVAGQGSGAEQRGGRVQVVGGQRQLVIERAQGVAELEPGIPERVPHGGGQLVEATRLAVVQQQDVDVTVRRKLLAAVATDGDEGDRRLAAPACRPVTRRRRRARRAPRRWRPRAPGTTPGHRGPDRR